MNVKTKSMRSPLGVARGLGSAKSGTEHWMLQRLTALALIPLSLFVLVGFFNAAVLGDYEDAVLWLHSPVSATFAIMFLLVGLRHATVGLQVIIEDYAHCECTKLSLLFVVKFLAVVFAVLGTLSVAKIFFGA